MVLLLLAGYARWSGCRGQGTSDCGLEIRIAGQLYDASGSTRREATRCATVDWADFEDVGRCPRGSVFPEDPRRVQAWSFEGYTPAERGRIVRELSRPGG